MKTFKMDLQLFAEGDAATQPSQSIPTDPTQNAAPVVEIKKPTAEELAAMTKEDLAKLKTDMQATAQAAVEEVEQAMALKEQAIADAAESWADQFRKEHGISWQVALIGGAFVIWQVGTAITRALGVH